MACSKMSGVGCRMIRDPASVFEYSDALEKFSYGNANMMTTTSNKIAQLNKYSSRITQPASQGASQAMLIATGLSWSDLDKPQIGIGSVWYEGNPCNMHLADLGTHVKRGAENAGCVGMRFNTIGVSDGISMGTDGMSYSLQSRDLIADSIETIMAAQW